MDPFRQLVKKDCVELLSRLQQTESVRFETFSEIWRDMKFDQIFYGTAIHKNRLFTRLVLETAYEFLLPPYSFQIRVGGLYLLYALFHSQTAKPQEKIRLALKDWEEIQKFEKDSVEAKHFDVVYILKKLLYMKAFVFTAMPRLLAFERKKKPQMSPVCENFVEPPSAPQTLISNNLLEEIANVHSLYENLKSSICPQSDSSLNLVHSDLTQTLRETVLDFYKWQKNKGSGRSRDEDSGEGPSTQQESSRRANLLASIKSKAYGKAAEASKSRRHRVVEVDQSNKPEPGSSRSGRYERIKQKTLKYRAIQKVHVSGDVWKDAFSKTTRITCLTACDKEKPPRSFKKKFKWKIEDS